MGAPATICFAHANGFPAGTYRVLFEAWREAGWRVIAPDKLGHDPRYPVTSNWPHLRDELIAFAEREAPGQRLHWVGHSMGGYLSLLAASRRPDLAAAVVLLDSPVVAGWRAHSMRVLKATRLIERAGPGRVSQRRRPHWPSRADAERHFASKAVFARWDPRVVADYVEAGTEADEQGGVRLVFKREVETRLYNTVPHHLAPLLKRHPPHCPIGYVGGRESAEGRLAGTAATQAIARGRVEWLAGSHLFPMEQPQAAAQSVLRLLAAAA